MVTRTELLDAFEAKLAAEGGYICPISGSQAVFRFKEDV